MSFSVRIENISKVYRIYDKPQHKLKEAILRGAFRRSAAYHREFWALRDINLVIPKGETLGILGQNGSGKSTILEIIAGVIQPTSGTLEINGRISALLELGAGFNRDFTGRENVFMSGAILGIPKYEMERRFDDIVAFADIGEFIDQPVKTYSSGMFVRLAFATAVQVDPDILIIDEALAVGDLNFRNRCYRKIEEIKKAGTTVLFVSHDTMAVRSLCTKAILMDRGKILESGTTNDVINAYHKLMAEKEEQYIRRLKGTLKIDMDERFTAPNQKGSDGEFRYGSGEAKIIDYQLLDMNGNSAECLETQEPFTIRSTALFYKDINEPLMGMTIKTLSGIEVGGTSTYHSEKPIDTVLAGTMITVEFTQKNILHPGEYTLSVGVSENTENGIRPLDRRFDVVPFRVTGKTKSYGIVDMGTEIKIVTRRHLEINSGNPDE